MVERGRRMSPVGYVMSDEAQAKVSVDDGHNAECKGPIVGVPAKNTFK